MAIQETGISTEQNGRKFNDLNRGETEIDKQSPLTVFLKDERARGVDLVGGKAASLAELNTIPGIKVPEAFVITATLNGQILAQNPHIANEISRLDEHSLLWLKAKLTGNEDDAKLLNKQIAGGGEIIEEAMKNIMLSPEAANTIIDSYNELCKKIEEENAAVAVRSSGICEDGSEFSFAGQNKTFLHQRGEKEIIDAAVKCIASQFGARAIEYRN